MKKIILFLQCVFIIYSCTEYFESTYLNYSEVVSDRAIDRGWIPQVIPKSSKYIYEWHDLDSNVGFGSFLFDKNDYDDLIEKLELIDKNEIIKFRELNIRREWDNKLSSNSSSVDYISQGYLFYKFKGFYLAIKKENCQVYFWNTISTL